jgi:hypothetical protein
MMENKNDMILLSIIAIVAIVAITVMMLNLPLVGTPKTVSSGVLSSGVNVGQVYEAALPASISSNCEDSDGQNYFIEGTVVETTSKGTNTFIDYCRNYNSDVLVENLCSDGVRGSLDVKCMNGCRDGVCLGGWGQ